MTLLALVSVGWASGTRHGAEGGLVQDVIRPFDRLAAGGGVLNVPFDPGEILPAIRAGGGLNLNQIAGMAGGQIIQPDHLLIQAQQRFQQVGANKARDAGDDPELGRER